MIREDMTRCLRWEIQMHEPFSRVWICKDYGRATTGADPAEWGRTVLAAYLAERPTRGETFRVIVRTDNGSQSITTPSQLTGPGWTADPAIRQALPGYLRGALA
ncbi:hypothetical protein [Streptomyces broussonetiae]|uniref:hypothetical protein n=1 Tax=Streptomyces broussonetiae TaxID=2686304 RepID=UPI0035DE9E0B